LKFGITNISIIPYHQPLFDVGEKHTTSAKMSEKKIVAKTNMG
jgi:hypothetical protein